MPTATLNPRRTKKHLDAFDWETLFAEELGWLRADGVQPLTLDIGDDTFGLAPVARLGGMVAYEVASPDGTIPRKTVRKTVHRAAEPYTHEHVLLFTDGKRQQTVWSYPVYDGKTVKAVRSHHFVKGQPPDLFLSKLAAMFFDMEEIDETGDASLVEVTRRVRRALDVEQVTKKFYHAFKAEQEALSDRHITGIDGERTRRHYASVLLTRLMFVFFLQKKGFLDGGDRDYLATKLAEHKRYIRGILDPPSFYQRFLRTLFFEGFAKRPGERSDETNALLGDVRYLNGGLFLEHPIEEDHPALDVADEAIEAIVGEGGVFNQFSWHLDDAPGGQSDEINPDVLGYILEKYVNQKAFGAYYTPPELTNYLCDATIDRFLVEAMSQEAVPELNLPAVEYDSLEELLTGLDDERAWKLLKKLEGLTVLDPAVGSGAFLVAALKKLLTVYQAVLGRAQIAKQGSLTAWLAEARKHPSTGYFLKREIITRNLYGVDLMPEAVEIAKLRLFLALVASAEKPEHLEPLPNIDFNLLDGNSLVGLLDVGEDRFIGDMFAAEDFRQALAEKNRRIDLYRGTSDTPDHDAAAGALLQIRDAILDAREEAQGVLDEALRLEMKDLGVAVKEATWNGKKATYKKRPVATPDVSALRPFHWAYEFSRILEGGGFDVIIANPPWDKLKPEDKEFFMQHSDAVSKNNMRVEDFKAHKAEALEKHPDVRAEYETYLSSFEHQSLYYRSAPDYAHQVAYANGRKIGSHINLYKLFLERCWRLLREGGRCGIILPCGTYSDLGAKGVRTMLFDESEVEGMFGFSNERFVFEEVHHDFKFLVLTFARGGETEAFDMAFRFNPREAIGREEIGVFLDDERHHVRQPVALVRELSPEAHAVLEFRSEEDRRIAEKLAAHPRLGDPVEGTWSISLGNELNKTNHSDLFKNEDAPGRLPLTEGKMIWQFDSDYLPPKYWIVESEGREALTKRGMEDEGQTYGYQTYRLAFRDVSNSSNERTSIATVLPPGRFCDHTIPVARTRDAEGQPLIGDREQLYLAAVFNSVVFDWLMRLKVGKHLSLFLVDSQPVPRLAPDHPDAAPIIEATARLVCVAPEFDALAESVGLGDHSAGATDEAERAALQAEIDARVAHLYGLTEDELGHILQTFPLVDEAYKAAVLAAYRALAPHPDTALVRRQIDDGESALVEFKETFAVDIETGDKHKGVLHSALKTVCGFLNSSGGTLLLGIADDHSVKGLDKDYARCQGTNQNADGLENKIATTLAARLDPPPSYGHVAVSFHTIDGQDVCRVLVQPSDQPTRLDGDFFVRDGNRTPKKSPEEAERWLANRARRLAPTSTQTNG